MRRHIILAAILLAMFLAIPLSSCISIPGGFPIIGPRPEVTGSPSIAKWEYEFTDFTNISVSSAFTVYISRSKAHYVRIPANENLLDYLNVYQRGDTLYIGLKRGRYKNVTCEAIIDLPSLLGLELSGASKGDISCCPKFSTSNPLKLRLSGASRVSGSIEAGDCTFNLSGASTIELAGSGNDADINASGASEVDLSEFPINDAKVTLSGASDATLNLYGKLDANLRSASHLKYIGEPTLGSIKTSEGSTLSKP